MGKTKATEDHLVVSHELNVERKFKLAGVEVTASAEELNKMDGVTATADEMNKAADRDALELTADGAITIKNGIVKLNKAGILAATLANPTDVTDDFKRLLIVSMTTNAHTVTVTGGFGDGGTGEDVATFSGAKGDALELVAHGGKWFIAGAHQVTIA